MSLPKMALPCVQYMSWASISSHQTSSNIPEEHNILASQWREGEEMARPPPGGGVT
jgi:hemolysin-activating ACP:hemolysin acyltransferase